jgi:S1-C subfamily serine protease
MKHINRIFYIFLLLAICFYSFDSNAWINKKDKNTSTTKPSRTINPNSSNDDKLIPIGAGTGFFVSSQGHIVSNNHVVGVCRKVTTKINGKVYNLDILATDRVNDLGIVKANFKPRSYLSIKSSGAKLGEDIVALGYPLTGRLSDSVKITKGIVSSLSGPENNYSQIQIDAALQPGNSGGPVLNTGAEVVGVASAGLSKLYMAKTAKFIPENVNFAVSAIILANFLKANKINYSGENFFSKNYSPNELAKIGEAVTLQLYCMNTRAVYEKLKSQKEYNTMLLDIN